MPGHPFALSDLFENYVRFPPLADIREPFAKRLIALD